MRGAGTWGGAHPDPCSDHWEVVTAEKIGYDPRQRFRPRFRRAERVNFVGQLLRACVFAMAGLLPLGAASAAAPDAIVGSWLTEDGASKVDIAAVSASAPNIVYAGKVVWLKEAQRDGKPLRDANNGDAAMRERPIMGLEILSGFKAAPGGGWTGGTVYSPRTGKTFPAELSLGTDGRLQVKVKAGIVSKTVYWTR